MQSDAEKRSRIDRECWVIGDPESRRVQDFQRSAIGLGMRVPNCLDWNDLIASEGRCLEQIPPLARVRIDSFGQRCETIASLIELGGGDVFPKRGQVLSLDHQYQGIVRAMEMVECWRCRRLESKHDVIIDQVPGDLAVMFDKWATHQLMLPYRPKTVLLPTEIDAAGQAIQSFADCCGGRVFVKPRYASSASGVCCYRTQRGRQQLIAAIEIDRCGDDIRLFNSLRVRSFTNPADIDAILRVLIPQGMIAEAAVSKARLDGERFDLRIVVIDGKADHLVVRQSPWPITNLHLGNRRGDLELLYDSVGIDRVNDCRQLAIHAAAQFPRTRYSGVDILLPRVNPPLVCEVNAFGDFLPNLTASGKTVYASILQIDAGAFV
ncbi:STM4014 family protein [Rhodopirellula sp. MGV]|uniref:STM4014 family protein n=1 Tax=Rhodopirellula sp. MGV TaxID=2023130 RepID=UPI000CD225B7|nr:STM4014 family protein [Rhodopirellula sp. MGV]